MKNKIIFIVSALFTLNALAVDTPATTNSTPQTASTATVTKTEDLLNQNVSTPADLDKLWDAYFSSKDPRYVQKVINTYQTIADDKRFSVNDLLYVASIPQRKQHEQDEKLSNILQHYKEKSLLEPFLVGAAALWSLGTNAHQNAEVKQIIQRFIETGSDKTITASLNKIVFRASVARVSVDPNIIFFTTNESDYVSKYLTPFTPEKMYQGLQNEFNNNDKPFMVVAFPLGNDEKMHLNIQVKQPDGKVVMENTQEYTGKDIKPNMATIETALIPLKLSEPMTKGIYQVTVSMNKNNDPSKELKYSFLVE